MTDRVLKIALSSLLASMLILGCAQSSDSAKTDSMYIAFDKNDANATGNMATQALASGETATLSPCGFYDEAMTFQGWATTPSGAVAYADKASYTMGTASVTLYAIWAGTSYKIGDTGPSHVGKVFYLSDVNGLVSGASGFHGLEVAPDGWNTVTVAAWINSAAATNFANGVSALPAGIGTGLANSNAIVATAGHTESAASMCRDYDGGGKTDWFLPSKDELQQLMYANTHGVVMPTVDYFY
jgi:hypothetical protein